MFSATCKLNIKRSSQKDSLKIMEWEEISALYLGRDFSLGWLKITLQTVLGVLRKKSQGRNARVTIEKRRLSNDDADGNENGKKALGLISKRTTLHVHHAFFVHFFAVTARLERESAWFHVLSRTGTQDNNFLFFSWTLIQSFRI